MARRRSQIPHSAVRAEVKAPKIQPPKLARPSVTASRPRRRAAPENRELNRGAAGCSRSSRNAAISAALLRDAIRET